ncbi:hypothetical protein GPEL0_01r4376 [Geoanaerobacter pelophilus]|uniref:Uncharacterized protein n=1 Tax=Geoanaerobacter pelophilus TaxID=60036 RepID=A0ABQ0MM70_9BACT|nr:hypothetical protein GPEL0_01r4376 [Geoanaerobacter pelophilus]
MSTANEVSFGSDLPFCGGIGAYYLASAEEYLLSCPVWLKSGTWGFFEQ